MNSWHAAETVGENSTSTDCSVFETNIRYQGNLLSAYDLTRQRALLERAMEIGNMSLCVFDPPNGMPPSKMNFDEAKTGQLQSPKCHKSPRHVTDVYQFDK